MKFVRRIAFVLLVVVGFHPVAARAQDGSEILRGRVFEGNKLPIPGATITVTGLNTQAVRTATTSANGSFTLLFSPPEGDYIINVRKIGYLPATFRSTRVGLSNVLIVGDVLLTSLAVKLDTITVTAQRKGDGTSAGGLEKDLLNGALFTLNPSDLLSLITSVPGVLAIGDSTYSVLGAAGNQNNATIDGMAFGGGNLPRDAIATSKLVTTTSDVSKAGFAGGQNAMTMRGGTDIFTATARGQFADSHLAWADPSSPIPVPRMGSASGFVGGPIVKKKSHYMLSWDLGDQSTEAYTLFAPRESILSQYGVLADTVTAVSSALNGLGVPLTAAGIPDRSKNHGLSSSLSLDFAPKATTTIRLTGNSYWYTNGGPGGGGLSYPSSASTTSQNFQFLSGQLSGYLHGFLDELGVSLNHQSSHGEPYLSIPGGSVRIGTEFSDGRTGLTSLNFGGGGGLSRNASSGYSLRNELSLLTPTSKHKIKVGQQVTYSASTSYSAGNLVGSFSYQTLADLQANRPASFSRTLTTYERSSSGMTFGGWIGDDWQPSKALQFQGGVRVDAAHSNTRPDYNPAIEALFGLRTDVVPNDIGWSPRLGFSWASKARRGNGPASGPTTFTARGEIPPELMMMLMMGPGGGRPSTLPGFTVSGSIGAYRGATSNSRIAALVDATGLPSTRTTLSCVGAATPIPDWTTISGNTPGACLDGTAPSTFSVSQPTVSVFDRNFHAPVSWRGNLTIDGIRLAKWNLLLSGVYSYGVNGESGLDVNLRAAPGFTLASEAGRPVYVSALDVVPTTGGVAPGASRIYSQYGRVTNTVSDINNWSRQLNATITPPHALFNNKVNLSFAYVLSNSRAETRGFGGGGGFGGGNFVVEVAGGGGFSVRGFGGGAGSATTAGDPRIKQWVPGTQPTHQFTLTTSARAWWFNFNIRTNVYSGFPYTPTVVGDVNGDGSSGNDRAFIANPSTTSDPELASQMNALLATAPSGARDCIKSQFDRIAGANSCHTQWQARMDLNMNFNPPARWGFGDRLRLTTTMVNASGALVRLFGLQNTPLGQYSAQVSPDSRLLYVTGFNPTTQQFQYRVNQLFGSPQDYGSNRTKSAPFQMQIGLEYKLGGPPTSPMARGLGLMPDNGQQRLSPDEVRTRLQKLSRDPIAPILARRDTLRLSPDQVAQMEAIAAEHQRTADSLLGPIVAYVVKKGKHVADADLSPKLAKAQPLIAKSMAAALVKATALLTPAQKLLMPAGTPQMAVPAGGPARPGVSGAPAGGPGMIMLPGGAAGGGATVIIKGGGGGT